MRATLRWEWQGPRDGRPGGNAITTTPRESSELAEGLLAQGRIGPYQLHKLVGTGGSALVFRAEDTVLGREAAVKIARHRDRHQECQREFERQTQAIGARIDHERIVRIFGTGLHPFARGDQVPFLAMEYVPGRTLYEKLLDEVRLRVRVALGITRDVLEALAAAHRLGVVHRDIKPDNVLVCRDGSAKLTDFYVEGGEGLRNPDGSYDYFGTPGYSAPEQVRGDEYAIDGRSDLYAVGVMLFEMIEGEPYHGRGNTQRLMAHTLSVGRMPRLSRGEGVTGRVSKLVSVLVHPTQRRRPADAVAALDLVERCLAEC
jgi:serine/threonine-protein kinase